MRKPIWTITLTLILLMVLGAAPGAAASPPLDVEILVPITLPPDAPAFGPFTASGPAVQAGVICATGEALEISWKASGFQAPTGLNVQVVYQFTCNDGSGEFFAKLQARLDGRGDKFNWVIVGGTGPYEKLHGVGQGTGLPPSIPDGTVDDLYTGALHVD